MVEYFCGGVVRSGKGGMKKTTIYYRMNEDGDPITGDYISFDTDKTTDNPPGWIIEIKKKGKSYSGFSYVRQHPDAKVVQEYEMRNIANIKAIDLFKLKKRSLKIREQIEEMTLGELREWANRSPTNKQALKFYLWELF